MSNKKILFSYFGGKYHLAPKIIPLFPDHHCYVEVFGGAAHVLLQKPRSKVEVYNDIDSNIYTLFKVLRDEKKFNNLYEMCQLTPYSREQKNRCHDMLHSDEPLSDVEKAWCFYMVINQVFSGMFDKTSWGFGIVKNRAKSSWVNKIAKLPLIVDRLRCVQIENRDFEWVLDTYDTDKTFFYLDPPYLPETRRDGEYAHEMTYQDHERLIEILQRIKGKVMLSGYPNELYDSLGWNTETFDTVCHAVLKTRVSGLQGEGKLKANQKRTEKIWFNYPLNQLTLFS